MPTRPPKRHRFQRGGPRPDQMCGLMIDGWMCGAVADADIHQMGDIERRAAATKPQDIVAEARAKLANPNYGMGKRNRELITKLCDEVEELRATIRRLTQEPYDEDEHD